jgi:hypothetical protein
MRTGRFRFVTRYTQRRWFSPPRPVQVLMVEVDEPIDAIGNRAVSWVEGNISDACNIESAVNSRLRRIIRRSA